MRFINHEFDSKAGERKARVEVGCYGDSTVYKSEKSGKCPTCRINHDDRGASHLSLVCGKSEVMGEIRFERGVFTAAANMVCGLRCTRANTDRLIKEKKFVCGCKIVIKMSLVKKIVVKKMIVKKVIVVKKMMVKKLIIKKIVVDKQLSIHLGIHRYGGVGCVNVNVCLVLSSSRGETGIAPVGKRFNQLSPYCKPRLAAGTILF